MGGKNAAIVVQSAGGDRLRVSVRDHELWADQPVEDGGADSAPTPTELFVAGLGACVAFYAERFLRRHQMALEGLSVRCQYAWAKNPHRVGAIDLSVVAPGLAEGQREAFLKVVEHCTVHSTLLQPPALSLSLQ